MRNEGDASRYQCSWCDEQASIWKLVQRAVVKKKKDGVVVVQDAEYAPACEFHMDTLLSMPLPEVVRFRRAIESKVWKGRQEKLC